MSAVTDRLAYIEKPSAVDSKSYTHSCLPVNGATFAPGSIIRIDIPCSGHGQYLDSQNSYLKFTINNTSAIADGTAEAFNVDGCFARIVCLFCLFVPDLVYPGEKI